MALRKVVMRSAFERISREFIAAKAQPLKQHPLAVFVREGTAAQVRGALPVQYQRFLVTGSPGQGNWAAVPWVAVFDPAVTESATRGYYIVYLFSADMRHGAVGPRGWRLRFDPNSTQGAAGAG